MTQKNHYPVRLIVVDPGHFHAALLQKFMYEEIDPEVHVYAPEGAGLSAYLDLIKKYNSRGEAPTHWSEKLYTGDDYLKKMLAEKAGNLVVLAGNNRKKTGYIQSAVDAGLNVMADKPMIINQGMFDELKNILKRAEQKKVLVYDIMTERYEITNIIQRELAQSPEVFGSLQKGTMNDPAVVQQSTHYFFKTISGAPLIRPAWYYDVSQQGEGLADVTTHLVDLIQWQCFPEQILDYQKDISMLAARHWPTNLSLSEFKASTQEKIFPDFLLPFVHDSLLKVYANGEMHYAIKGVNAKVSVQWGFQAVPGGGDTHYAMLRGTKASLVVKEDESTGYHPVLYIEPSDNGSGGYPDQLIKYFAGNMEQKYPGIVLRKKEKVWEVFIPEKYKTGHEEQFGRVTRKFLQYLKNGRLPAWEISFLLAKYYTIALALRQAEQER
jgi:predicted dehydrogenase